MKELQIKEKLDRNIVSVGGGNTRNNSRYIIMPAKAFLETQIDHRAEMITVTLNDGRKALLVVPFEI